jgi:eukaryotic-like serine/threonine-protein kinase
MAVIETVGGRYYLQAQIGQGGMGEVYKAYDRLTGEFVALKRLRSIAVEAGPDDTAYNALAQSLAREFHMLASLKHPHIIDVKDFGFDAKTHPYFTMLLLDDPRSLLDATRGLTLEDKLNYIVDLLQALIYLHRQRVLHRDLKPSNVVIDQMGHLHVLDFGIATSGDYALEIAGTMNYLAPELLLGEAVSVQSDLYSVGVMIYEVLAEQPLFSIKGNRSLAMDILQHQPDLAPTNAPIAVQQVIARLLLKSPEYRYTDARQVILALCRAMNWTPPNDTAVRESFLMAASFVGRQDELAQLMAGLQRTQEGHGSSWIVSGELGVGKSRLLDEVRVRALVAGYNVLWAVATAGSERYRVFHSILARLLLTTSVSAEEAIMLRLVVQEVERLTAHELSQQNALTPEDIANKLPQTIKNVILRQKNPLLIILEDVHLEPESLDLVQDIQANIQSLPIMIVCSYRSDENRYLYGRLAQDSHHIALSRFTRREINTLASNMLGGAGSNPAVLRLIEEQSEGNIFLMIDLIELLAENITNIEDLDQVELPESIMSASFQTVVKRRLERVPLDYRPMLYLAAVIGREIDFDLLEYIDDEFDYEEWLSYSGDAALLTIEQGRWMFAHDKIRDGLLVMVDEGEVKRLNRLAAEAIEAVHPGDAAYYLRLLEHWHHTGNLVKEIDYLHKLARSVDVDTATHLLDRTLHHLPGDHAGRSALLDLYTSVTRSRTNLNSTDSVEG